MSEAFFGAGMFPEWVSVVQEILGRLLTIDEIEMGARMATLGEPASRIASILEVPTPPPAEEETFVYVPVGSEARLIP